eukprot:TRINITY_DN20737_c0_g1_i2.p1 TRINITY_DN20737_c0_g1~~TRINITY_DN20737_c0_g1_i2.p1  ORF type:complete len:1096 (-),score=231.64 TRINITY_DN20737_c0_g1_i2:56-3343(-)
MEGDYDQSLALYARMKLKSIESLRVLLLWHWDMHRQVDLARAVYSWVASSIQEVTACASMKTRGLHALRVCLHALSVRPTSTAIAQWRTAHLSSFLSAISGHEDSDSAWTLLNPTRRAVGLRLLSLGSFHRASPRWKTLLTAQVLAEFKANWRGSIAAAAHTQTVVSGAQRQAILCLCSWEIRTAKWDALLRLSSWRRLSLLERMSKSQDDMADNNARAMTDLAQGAMWSRGLQVMKTMIDRCYRGTLTRAVADLVLNHQLDKQLLKARKVVLAHCLRHLATAMSRLSMFATLSASVSQWAADALKESATLSTAVMCLKGQALYGMGWMLKARAGRQLAAVVRQWNLRRQQQIALAAGTLKTLSCVARLQSQLDTAHALLGWRLRQSSDAWDKSIVIKMAERQRMQDNIHKRDLNTRLGQQRALDVLKAIGMRDWVHQYATHLNNWRGNMSATTQAVAIFRMAINGVGAALIKTVYRHWFLNTIQSQSDDTIGGIKSAARQARTAGRHHRGFIKMCARFHLWNLLGIQKAVDIWHHGLQAGVSSQKQLAITGLDRIACLHSLNGTTRSLMSWRANWRQAHATMTFGCKVLRSFLHHNNGLKEMVSGWREGARLWRVLGRKSMHALSAVIRALVRGMEQEGINQWKQQMGRDLQSKTKAMELLAGVLLRKSTRSLKLTWISLVMAWKASKRKKPRRAQAPNGTGAVMTGTAMTGTVMAGTGATGVGEAYARCTEGVSGWDEEDLDLAVGDIVAVLNPDQGNPFWHGICGKREGKFPASCVQLIASTDTAEVMDTNGRMIRHNTELADEVDRLERERAVELSELKRLRRENKDKDHLLYVANKANKMEAMFALFREMDRSSDRQRCGRAVASWLMHLNLDGESLLLESMAVHAIAHNTSILGARLVGSTLLLWLNGQMAQCVRVWWQGAHCSAADMQMKAAGEEMELCLEFKDFEHGFVALQRHLSRRVHAAYSRALLDWRMCKGESMLLQNQAIVEDCMLEVVGQNNVRLGLRLICFVLARENQNSSKSCVTEWKQKYTLVRSYLLSLIHISEPTRLLSISYAVFCLKKKKKTTTNKTIGLSNIHTKNRRLYYSYL